MAVRNLTLREQKTFDTFSTLNPILVETSQVTLGSGDDQMYTIEEPVVYQIPNTDSYLVFGNIKKAMSLEQMKRWLQQHAKPSESKADEKDNENIGVLCGDDCNEKHNHETDINQEDVDLLVTEANISKKEAIEALKRNGNDVVTALVELTKNK